MHNASHVSDEAPYADLTPDLILDAIESVGITPSGSILALNSYENRVYQIGTETGFVVAKFYRPGRWSDEAILEEHAFSHELLSQEIPVVAPLELAGETLNVHQSYRFAVFERRGGRWPELGSSDERQWMGRFLGRIHAVGALQLFEHRPEISIERFGTAPAEELLASDWIPGHLVSSYQSIVDDLLATISQRFDEVAGIEIIRIHGDCHPGNVLWTDDGPHFVDLDDCMNGPRIQDLWLFLSGSREEMTVQLADLLEGYTQFSSIDLRELHLVEALRSLRMIHYAAWIARRWTDPAFPRAFPWFADNKYWEEHVLALREQRALLDEPALPV
jgi:Ser/Thr protein kinase RdoA (MazF antagonist)